MSKEITIALNRLNSQIQQKNQEILKAVQGLDITDPALVASNEAAAQNRIQALNAAKVQEKAQGVAQEEIASELKMYSDGTKLSDQWATLARA
jgi:hypothetical protein